MKTRKTINAQQNYPLCSIESISDDGRGVAHFDGLTVFVRGAIPGEEVRLKITKKKKRYAFADVAERVHDSPFANTCYDTVSEWNSGAPLVRLDYEQQLHQKVQLLHETLARIAHYTVPVGITKPIIKMAEPNRYRNKARYACALNPEGQIAFGSYLKDSKQVLFQHDNILYKKENKAILDECSVWANQQISNAPPFKEVLIRSAQSGATLVAFFADRVPVAIEILLERLLVRFPFIVSIVLHSSDESYSPKILYGSGLLEDRIGSVVVNLSARSFFQVNHIQSEQLYKTILEFAKLNGTEEVWDLYCGVGSISLWLAPNAVFVRGNELSGEAIALAKHNARLNQISNVAFESGDATHIVPKWLEKYQHPAVVIVDPPRNGCAESVIDSLLVCLPERIVYVSCKPATLARDLVALRSAYCITQIQAVDMFPHTAHLESVVLLEKTKHNQIVLIKN